MGMMFPLRYTNLIAYFTTDMPSVECSVRDLRGFFHILQTEEWRLKTRTLESEWPRKIQDLATAAARVVDEHTLVPQGFMNPALNVARDKAATEHTAAAVDEPWVSIEEVFETRLDILHKLHRLFREDHQVFALGVANQRDHVGAVHQALAEALRTYEHHVSTLFLLPDDPFESALDFTYPFPGASDICRSPERWPGILIWNRFGNTLFLPLEAGREALRNSTFLSNFATQLSTESLKRIEERYVPPTSAGRQVRILHLSDLHFGTDHAAKNQDYLLAVIDDQLQKRFDRVVITGDLFDDVWKPKWRAFEAFRKSLTRITKKEPIVVPGNHDMRIKGNRFWKFGESYKYLAELGVKPLQEDDDLQCLFFCFNSSKAGNFAKGEVVEEDLIRMGAEYHTLAARKPIANYLRVALVHHHPFKFEAAAEGMTAKLLKAFHIPEGKLVDMVASERFVKWCADRGIQLILHGHRHVLRKISQAVPIGPHGVNPIQVTAVGCGTSLGAEGIAKSFNLISWDPISKRWATAFYLDRSGGGFKEVRVTSSRLAPMPTDTDIPVGN